MRAVFLLLPWVIAGIGLATGCGEKAPVMKNSADVVDVEHIDGAAETVETEVTPDESSSRVTDEEAVQVVVDLFSENQALKKSVEELKSQVAALEKQLAEAMIRLDGMRSPEAGTAKAALRPAAELALTDLTKLTVLEVNRRMGVAVVSGGVRAGMKVGMNFSVVRGDEVIATLKLVDVRDLYSGGLIDRAERDRYPEVGDKLILSNKQN